MVATSPKSNTIQTSVGAVVLTSSQDYYSIYLDGVFYPINSGAGHAVYVFARVQRLVNGGWKTIETGGFWVTNRGARIGFHNYAVTGSAMRVHVDVYPGRWSNWNERYETTGSKKTASVGSFAR